VDINSAFDDSERLVTELLQIIDLPTIDSERVRISDVACSLALEHGHSVRALLATALLPSALVVHRAQFEVLVRSVWIVYAAREEDCAKLTGTLDLASERAAKNMPTVNEMMQHVQKSGPAEAIHSVLCNANGLGVMACMQAVVLSGEQTLQRQVLDIAAKYPGCMPQLLQK
jgi:hypothetical protein